MRRFGVNIKQTIATVLCEEEYIGLAVEEIMRQRNDIERYIKKDPFFQMTLEPYEVGSEAPEIVRKMAEAGCRAGVGPMAAVAGAIAEYALKELIRAGARHAIVDNGGDIAMYIDRPVTVGIYGGERMKEMGLRFYPRNQILGVCTSSATVGPSISFGKADAAIVVSRDVVLADAIATALGNVVKDKEKGCVEEALCAFIAPEIEGMMVIADDIVGVYGNLDVVKVEVNCELISKMVIA